MMIVINLITRTMNCHRQKERKKQEALKAYQQVIALAPNFPIGYNQLAYYYAANGGNLDEALTLARRAVECVSIVDTLGRVLCKWGNYKGTIDQFTLALQGLPNSSTIRYHLGMADLKSDDTQSPLNDLRNALWVSRQFPEADETKAMIRQIEAQ